MMYTIPRLGIISGSFLIFGTILLVRALALKDDFDQIVEEFRYRMNKEKLNRYKRKEMKRFEGKFRER